MDQKLWTDFIGTLTNKGLLTQEEADRFIKPEKPAEPKKDEEDDDEKKKTTTAHHRR